MRGAGGTSGSGVWVLWGYNAFGLSLLPLLVGIGWLFFDGKSVGGWLLTACGALSILAGIIANLHIYFAPTSLFDTLVFRDSSREASVSSRDRCAPSRSRAF